MPRRAGRAVEQQGVVVVEREQGPDARCPLRQRVRPLDPGEALLEQPDVCLEEREGAGGADLEQRIAAPPRGGEPVADRATPRGRLRTSIHSPRPAATSISARLAWSSPASSRAWSSRASLASQSSPERMSARSVIARARGGPAGRRSICRSRSPGARRVAGADRVLGGGHRPLVDPVFEARQG